MATANDILIDALERVRESVHEAVEGLSREDLAYRPDEQANSIAWLVWHLTRVQDDHVADLIGSEQLWEAGGWAARFDLPFDDGATGYGQGPAEVAQVRPDAELLTGYYDAVHSATRSYLETLGDEDFAKVVDERWDPPVTLGTRLVSVINDDTQHVGQAAYVRGLVERR
jgi:uncharacterized damage-inducible protein DinB